MREGGAGGQEGEREGRREGGECMEGGIVKFMHCILMYVPLAVALSLYYNSR